MGESQVYTEGFVGRSIEDVWKVIADLDGYSQWNPLFSFEGGPLEEGKKVRLVVTVPGGFKARVPVLVERFRAQDELRWKASFLGFSGSHWLKVRQVDEGQTQITHGEEFRGLGFIWRFVRDDVHKEYQAVTDALIEHLTE